MVCEYNLPSLPDGVVQRTEENQSDPSVLKWTGTFPIPKIGDKVTVYMNSIGPGVVDSYFHEAGYLGVCVKVDTPPDWHKKQNEGTKWDGKALIFGRELQPYTKGN